MITIEQKGDFKHTDHFLKKMSNADFSAALAAVAREGVRRLAAATPIDSGLAATSWGFEIKRSKRSSAIVWTNNDIESGFPVAIMLQYGYATGTGGYVAGIDYINPAIKPIFDDIADELWKVVTSA